jgi:type IX secretion system PorP/SprF family membrane protein
MSKLFRKIATTLFICASYFVSAQYDAMFTQFMYNEMFINPGYTGSREAMSATMLHRQQWVSFPGRPITTTFSLHGPLLQNKMGLGLSVLNEKIGVLNRNLIYLSYAYRIKTGDNSTLSLGLMGGIHNQVNKFNDLKTSRDGSPDPQVMQSGINATSFNFGEGIYFTTKTFYAGLSIPRMINDKVTFTNGESVKNSSIDPSSLHYYLMAGNLFTLNTGLNLKVQGMLKAVKGAPVQADMNATFLIKKIVWIGAGYRTNSAMSALLGVQASPQLFIGYSYDYDLNGMQRYSNGSHEIVLSYLFMYDLKKVLSPRYF